MVLSNHAVKIRSDSMFKNNVLPLHSAGTVTFFIGMLPLDATLAVMTHPSLTAFQTATAMLSHLVSAYVRYAFAAAIAHALASVSINHRQ